jgi:hypothetical protein
MVCNTCGNQTESTWRYCRHCGTELATATGGSGAAETPAAPETTADAAPSMPPAMIGAMWPPVAVDVPAPTPAAPVEPAPMPSATEPPAIESPKEPPTPMAPPAPAALATDLPGAEPPAAMQQDALAPVTAVPPYTPLWRRPWFPRAAIAAAVVAVVAGFTYTILNDVQTHSSLSTTQAKLASTQATLKSTQSQLADTKSTLASTQSDLSTTKQTLSDTQGKLASTQQQLTGVQNTVSQQNQQLQTSSTEIKNLGTCLTGVLTALDYGAAGNYAAENATLDKIAPACRDGLKNLP